MFTGGLKGEHTKVEDYNTVVGVKVHNTGDAKGEKAVYRLVKAASHNKWSDSNFMIKKCIVYCCSDLNQPFVYAFF